MESVRSAFHAQLATVMDSLLAAAVCEIAKIFESSLCEQQAELAQKTEEISVLRCKLEKQERRQKPKGRGGGSEEEEVPSGGREGNLRQHAGSGLNVEKSVSSDSDPEEVLCMLKEEVTGQEGASVKHEHAGSRSVTVQVTNGNFTAGEKRQVNHLSPSQIKIKVSSWNQNGPLQDQASAPFLSISQSGRCSPRTDPSLPHTAEWLPGLDTVRGGVPGLENLQADSTDCSAPASSSAGADPSCFQPGFRSDEISSKGDDGSFQFLDQEPKNQNSSQNSEQSQDLGQRGARADHPQAPSGQTVWQTRDDRAVRSPVNHTRRVTNFGNRESLRPQSNSSSLPVRQLNSLIHPPAPSGGNGRPYSCPYCTKCFTYPSHQRRHLLRHTGVRLHPCQFCDKSFLTPSELTVHTRTHTGERPFGCAQCGKRFARSGNLRAHQRDVHMGKRPFACTECGKRFAHRGNLRVHNHRVHQGDPYYIDDQPEAEIGPSAI